MTLSQRRLTAAAALIAVAIVAVLGLVERGDGSPARPAIATNPEDLAAQLTANDLALRQAIDAWRAAGDPPAADAPPEVMGAGAVRAERLPIPRRPPQPRPAHHRAAPRGPRKRDQGVHGGGSKAPQARRRQEEGEDRRATPALGAVQPLRRGEARAGHRPALPGGDPPGGDQVRPCEEQQHGRRPGSHAVHPIHLEDLRQGRGHPGPARRDPRGGEAPSRQWRSGQLRPCALRLQPLEARTSSRSAPTRR